MSTNDYICESENIVAYIEGDLEAEPRAALEEHFKQCARCTSELQAQRLFICELDSALASRFELPVPPNFAQVVAVHAESDMRGVRDRSEHRKALRFSIILGLAAFALLGVAASQAVILNVRSAGARVFGVLGFVSRATLDAGAGFVVASRVISRGLLPDSKLAGLAGLFLLALAIVVLSFLISRYHRTRVVE